MKKMLFLGLSLLLLLVSCQPTEPTQSPVNGKRVACLINMPESDIFELFGTGFKEAATKLGMTTDLLYSGGNDETFDQLLKNAVDNEAVAGIFISHMNKTTAYTAITKILEQRPDLKIVTFDTEFIDATGKVVKIPQVTQIFQDDKELAKILLDELIAQATTQPVKVLKVWKGPNFLSSFDRRNETYSAYEELGKIQTVETVFPQDSRDKNEEEHETMIAVSNALNQHPEGIDAVWCAYDIYGQGAFTALKDAHRNIPLYSVDLSNRDIQAMLEENSNWKACACTDFKANGEQALRVLALEINNQYENIPSDFIEMAASLIKGSTLQPTTTIETIYEVAPASYGDKSELVTCDWLKQFIGY